MRNALRGIEEYSHLWLIWEFSEAVRDTWSPMVRPPRLGGNKRVGVFATRSVPAQSDRAFFGKAGACGAASGTRAGASSVGGQI